MTRKRLHYGLFERLCSFEHLLASARKAARAKRRWRAPAHYMLGLEREVLNLQEKLQQGTWHPGPYRQFEISQPKKRVISAAPFADRVVHHALVGVIGPLFEAGFITDSYANRKGKGTHAALDRFEHFLRRHHFVLRADIWRYFPAIDHTTLKNDLARRIGCARTLALAYAIIDGSNSQEPVVAYFEGDDLFSPFDRRRGLPIGNQTSQFFSNVYLDGMDHFIKEVLRIPGYVRYVDDFALFADDLEQLAHAKEQIAAYLARRRLLLHPRKTFLSTCNQVHQFLGIEMHPDGRRRLDSGNVDRFVARLWGLRQSWKSSSQQRECANAMQARVQSWVAHSMHANTVRLRAALLPKCSPDGRFRK